MYAERKWRVMELATDKERQVKNWNFLLIIKRWYFNRQQSLSTSKCCSSHSWIIRVWIAHAETERDRCAGERRRDHRLIARETLQEWKWKSSEHLSKEQRERDGYDLLLQLSASERVQCERCKLVLRRYLQEKVWRDESWCEWVKGESVTLFSLCASTCIICVINTSANRA